MRAMDALKKLLMTTGAASVGLLLLAGPVAAEEEPADDATAEEPADDEAVEDEGAEDVAEEESGRIPIAETPRDRIGLILLGALALGGGAAAVNANRQLKGERPQASGDFRWR
jgi:hypothetical protein